MVAVDHVERNKNLTPPSEVDYERTPNYGGADEYLAFIRDELIPWVDTNYRTHGYRVLVGHSYGGLFALHTMITNPDVFDAFILISPSLQWNDQRLVNQAEAFLKTQSEFKKDLFIAMGNEGGRALGGVRKLTGILGEINPPGLRWNFHRMPEETHGSVPYRSTHQGLSAVFTDWYLDDPFALYELGGLDAIDKHYAQLSDRLGFEKTTPYSTILDIAYALLQADRLEDAAVLAAQADDFYIPNIYGYIAGQYAARGDSNLARKYYEKVVEMSPGSTDAKEQLIAVGGEVRLPNVAVSQAVLESYTGSFKWPPKLDISVTLEEGKLFIAMTGVEKSKLMPMSQNRFYTEGSDSQYEFSSDETGGFNTIRMYMKGSMIKAGRVD